MAVDEVTALQAARDQLREVCAFHGRTESVETETAVNRVLATRVTADHTVPPEDRAAADGYAVQAADTFAAGDRSPVELEPVEGDVSSGQAVRVHTGCALPDGADAVVRAGQTAERSGSLLVFAAVAGGENVTPAGKDVSAGQNLFEAGRRLRPSDTSLLLSAGTTTVVVAERPRVCVLPGGEAAAGPGGIPQLRQLVSSLVEAWGGNPTTGDTTTDADAAIRAVEDGFGSDLVVTFDGPSDGDRDAVSQTVRARGELLFDGVTANPGSVCGASVVGGTPVLLLPRYPVSCLVGAVQFLRPAISRQAGTTPPRHPTVRGRLTEKLRSAPGEHTFARVKLSDKGGDNLPGVAPVRIGGAGVMSSVTQADGWVVVPESREGIPAGETVSVQQWERSLVDG